MENGVNTVVSLDFKENVCRYRKYQRNRRVNKHTGVGSQPCYFVKRSMPGLTVSAHAWGDYSWRREICCLQHGETESNVWNTFVWSCPTWPSRWGMPISIDWPSLKSCQAVCDECMRGEIYSSLMRAVQPCGPDGSRASLKFGVQSMITDSCYFFSLPRVSI